MAKLYRTPDLLKRTKMVKKEIAKGVNAPNVEYILTTTINTMVKEELDKPAAERKPLTQTNIIKRAGVGNSAIKTYKYIFSDLIPFINKFQLEVVPKDDDEKNIPSWNTLEKETMDKTYKFVMGVHDPKWIEIYDDLDESLQNKIDNFDDAYFGFADGRWIHPDFEGKDINKIFSLISEKYHHVQELKAEYEYLKKQLKTESN